NDVGAARVELTALDKGGNSATASATVNVAGIVPKPVIGASAGAVTLGYGPQEVTLSASDGAGSRAPLFTWSPAAGLSTASGPVTTFTPTAAGTFAFTAQAGNENGCYGAATVTVPVIDARCGDGKVLVCEKTGSTKNPATQLCIAPNAVAAHLRKGDTLGACGN
ncbi:MAG TPA: PKD domain-containing protein, partial [Telluria sp.]|nr:PKD domain-containing protein [Telluria sp.]